MAAVAVLGLALLGGGFPGARAATTGFTNGFDGVKAGETLELRWEGVEEKWHPLCVTAQVMQRGVDGSVTVFKANLTDDIKGNSFVWKGVPFPLTFVPDGMYQLEIHPSTAGETTGGSGWPLLAKSPFFSITKASDPAKPSSSSSPDKKNGGGSNVKKSLAIGLGVAIGVPSVVALALVSWCFRRRRRRALLERRRRTRRDFVIS